LSTNFDNFFGEVGCVISNRRLDFGGDPDRKSDPGIPDGMSRSWHKNTKRSSRHCCSHVIAASVLLFFMVFILFFSLRKTCNAPHHYTNSILWYYDYDSVRVSSAKWRDFDIIVSICFGWRLLTPVAPVDGSLSRLQ